MPLLNLPSELLGSIVDLLTPEEYLTIKFVCKRLDQVTKRQDGTSKKNIKDMFLELYEKYPSPPYEYGPIMAALEAGLSDGVKLERLTCSHCGNSYGICELDGTFQYPDAFDTKQFDRLVATRCCMDCITEDGVHEVKGRQYVWCHWCKHYCPKAQTLHMGRVKKQFGDVLRKKFEDIFDHIGTDTNEWWLCKRCLQVDFVSKMETLLWKACASPEPEDQTESDQD